MSGAAHSIIIVGNGLDRSAFFDNKKFRPTKVRRIFIELQIESEKFRVCDAIILKGYSENEFLNNIFCILH